MRSLLCALICTIPLALTAPASAAEPSLLDETIYRLQMGKTEDVTFLVKRLGNPNATDRMGWPLLAIASSRTDKEGLGIVKALVDMGADVNFGGGGNHFPIIYAVQNSNIEVARYLLDQGANYRATDAHGMRLVDYARQSGNKEMATLIENAIDRDILNLAKTRSKSNLDSLTHQLAFHSCALQYYSFYYKSKQDPIPEAEQQQMLAMHQKMVSDSMGQLVTLFKIKTMAVTAVYEEPRKIIWLELENLVSNRWRRQKGVGQEGDMDARCVRIAKPWEKGHFNNSYIQN